MSLPQPIESPGWEANLQSLDEPSCFPLTEATPRAVASSRNVKIDLAYLEWKIEGEEEGDASPGSNAADFKAAHTDT